MSKPKTRRQLVDEAYERTAGATEMVAGQLDIDGSIVGGGPSLVTITVVGMPESCPECGKHMTTTSGWTALAQSVRHPALQCGSCGAIVTVTQDVYDAVKEAVRARFAELNAPKPKPQPKRSRGAR